MTIDQIKAQLTLSQVLHHYNLTPDKSSIPRQILGPASVATVLQAVAM